MSLLTKYMEFFESFPLNRKLRSIENQLKTLYVDFKNASKSVKGFLEKLQETVSEINLISEIPGSKLLNNEYVCNNTREEILDTANYFVEYSFVLFTRKIKVYVICLEPAPPDLNKLREDIKMIYLWLYVASLYANKKCGGKTMTIYLYPTKLKRQLPNTRINILSPEHINGGLSDVCRNNSELAIFRKEEWYKVFIHETFHNLGLDFSVMNISSESLKLRKHFNIKSEMLLFETYTETWAEIINIVILSFQNTNNFKDFHNSFNKFMRFERVFSLFQCVKVLNFMGLTHYDLLDNSEEALLKKQTLYKEETNVFCYYVLKNFVIQHYDLFILWCHEHNIELLQFKNTPKNLKNFVDFIKEVSNEQKEYKLMEKIYREKFDKSDLFQTMKMTICEFN